MSIVVRRYFSRLEGSMGQEALRLPSRFPVGTRYVIEGRAGLISLRYLEFPDGRKVDLPSDLAPRAAAGARQRRLRRPLPRKKVEGARKKF